MTTTKATDELLTRIAAEHWDGLETLERRGGDSLDFHETAVWSIKEALQQAFELGRQTADESAPPVVADADAGAAETCIDCGSEKIEEGQCQDCAETTGDILTPDGPVDTVAEIKRLLGTTNYLFEVLRV